MVDLITQRLAAIDALEREQAKEKPQQYESVIVAAQCVIRATEEAARRFRVHSMFTSGADNG